MLKLIRETEVISGACSLVIFRNLLKNSTFSAFIELQKEIESGDFYDAVSAYSEFVREVYIHGGNFTEYILNVILEDENFYTVNYSNNSETDDNIRECLENELLIIEKLAKIGSLDIKQRLRIRGYVDFLPSWNVSEDINFTDEYMKRIADIEHHGYGMFAKYHTFMLRDGEIIPVKNPDNITLENMIGYEAERQTVIDNTEALIAGKTAGNVLLYGDAGTGKSSTVKAIANAYKEQGLRLIEVAKKQMRDIPFIVDTLSRNPLKFILFIDDLSFSKDDDEFRELKAILEGSVSARTKNIVIYATSNRRHLVKESFSDRDGDDIHHNDTVQELISLSERFGITVNFSKPDKSGYLGIVEGLAEQYELDIPHEQLMLEAERFALRKSGRSPRAARHFIEYMKTKEN